MSRLALLLLVPAVGRADDLADAKKLSDFTPAFEKYAFDGDDFPALKPAAGFEQAVTFYDATYAPVTKPTEAGVYGAVVVVTPTGRPASKRYATLVKAKDAKPVDAKAARTLAGEILAGNALGTNSWDDALAHERQWWVGLKRKLNGWDKKFPGPVVAPDPIKTEPAPVVREGKPEEAGVKPDTSDKIDAACKLYEADTDEAFAVCIVRNGVIVHHKAYGTRAGKPMTVDTPSWMASVTKAFCAANMLVLIDRKLVDFDDDAAKFFPSLKGVEPKGKPLTVRNLFNHTGGLADWRTDDDKQNDIDERLAQSYGQIDVGREWKYGGSGNALGGKIIEAVSGEALPIFYRKHFLEPLGCTGTFVVGSHADMKSIPLDMAKFGQLLLNKGSYGKWRFFTSETFDKMLPAKMTFAVGMKERTFGFGLDGSPTKFGHGAASAATFNVDVEKKLVTIVTRDKIGKNYDKYQGKVMDAVRAGLVD